VSREVRQLHKETSVAILTGLAVNFPLNLILMSIWGYVIGWTLPEDTLKITMATTFCMTIVAYTRHFAIRRHFSKQEIK
jgi:hypothetical protein